MSFILTPGGLVDPANVITLSAATTTGFVVGTPYQFTITAYDSFTTYAVSTNNGTATLNASTGVVTWTPATTGPTGAIANLTIGNRTLSLVLAATVAVDYYAVSGGGAGGKNPSSGGGGGGGWRVTGTANVVKGASTTVTVGGGAGSSAFGTATVAGGGNAPLSSGNASGGTSPSGFAVGTGPSYYQGGGGAGAGGAGGFGFSGSPGSGGVGGAGLQVTWFDQTIEFGGGGGGAGGTFAGQPGGAGGSFGGGNAGGSGTTGSNGAINQGGGGGGGDSTNTAGAAVAFAGGSGVVWARYLTSGNTATITGTYTTSVVGAYTYIRWTSSGTVTFS